MTTTQTIDLYGQQFAFVRSSAPNALLVGGIGSGKTIGGAARALAAAYGRVGDVEIPTPNLGVVTAPTYTMLRDATLRTFLDVAGAFVVDYNQSDHRVTLTNGSEILFRSADSPDRLRGPTISWYWGDEAAYYVPMVWRVMIGRLRQFGRRGFAWLTTTPKGRNWLWQEFVQRQRATYRRFNLRTGENPFVDLDFYLDLLEAYGATDFARQELDGDFIAFEGLIYPEFDRDTHVARVLPKQFKEVVAGVDWGFVNPGVILVGGVDGDGRLWVTHEEYSRKRRIEEWVEVAKQVRETWGVERWYCDPSEPDYIEKFKAAGLKAEAADNSVNTGIQTVRNRLVPRKDGKPRLLVHPGCVNVITEYDQYQWASNRDGLLDKPLKANDHAMDALRYLAMGVGARKKLRGAAATQRWA